jgi:hypothetical protein
VSHPILKNGTEVTLRAKTPPELGVPDGAVGTVVDRRVVGHTNGYVVLWKLGRREVIAGLFGLDDLELAR